ncbi:hypothetical protein COX69_02170 [Candidatus Falkowbacteria bacterium CG_4_10_14_0_2_um_filter_48_10]|uniref:Segregation and condensation protein A n=1 Tax=Candidatus Falkowbacteria bacterium CG23_combo_of_CG06-09_8_20_14_all_49_15 TaxID=1974572 RepID=A0A2G9ZMZ8_9BACT|nr:MAG: hypothetical protein COX22_01715 [Candidatus Falkowbacteria bacterium CG23_combo_of_CG06-09_8_20_14_all_49_15]PJA08498.1 MAG: hypothetical protein COX69_02170 [Candidatus Falkowbacteria bacterium CG_4_10_14_0_2_um_filter_48_10]
MMQIQIEKFSGPLDLLLKIVEQEDLDITQISLAKIADEYLRYLEKPGHIDPEDMADFLLVAAKLLVIKSRALLPNLAPEEEQEISELEAQLRMYKEFVEAAKKIQAIIGQKKFMFAREFNRKIILPDTNFFSPPKKMSRDDLRMVFDDLLARLKPAAQALEESRMERKIRIEDKIAAIQEIFLGRMRASFRELLAGADSKTEIIVCFLAILEMTKQKFVTVEQGNLFEDIIIHRNELFNQV